MRMLRGVSSGWALGVLLAGAMGCGGGEADVSDGADGDAGCVEADEPDALGTDSNCDGVDGVVADSVFVDGSSGDDENIGSREAPVATIARGIALADERGTHAVLVSEGVYAERLILSDGVSLHGGYAAWNGWARESLVDLDTTVTASESPVLTGTGIGTLTRITGIRISASAALSYGSSSVAVGLLDADGVSFEDCELVAGDGAPGTDGETNAQFGAPGNPGDEGASAVCFGEGSGCSPDPVSVPTTPGAARACGCGAGGRGGAEELSSPDRGVGDGQGGEQLDESASTCIRAGVGSSPSNGGSGSGSGNGTNGRPGAAGASGPPGTAGTSVEAFTAAGYAPTSGGTGGAGSSGDGGGGGGASGFTFCPGGDHVLVGSAGGSGGSGGCGGSGGQGGGGGGASIALYLWRSTSILTNTVLVTAAGGDGGAGAEGGDGGEGGDSGPRGSNDVVCPGTTTKAHAGGAGGAGGDGGRGGRGGGGAGGAAIAVVLGEASAIAEGSSGYFAQIGGAGAGGPGGNEGEGGVACSRYVVATSECSDF